MGLYNMGNYMRHLYFDGPGGGGNALSAGKRRDNLSIIAEVLEITREGALKTNIMYKANLSFTQLNDYLNLMTKNKLLNVTQRKEKDVYVATEKGMNFLQRYREINELLKTEVNSEDKIIIPDFTVKDSQRATIIGKRRI